MRGRVLPVLALLIGALAVGSVLVVAAPGAVTPGAARRGARSPARPAVGDLRVVSDNLLHGVFCDDGADCDAPDRVALLVRQLAEARCPQVVGLQEVNDNLRRLLAAATPTVCGGRYHAVFGGTEGNDSEYVLTTLPSRRPQVRYLPGGLRRASRVELRSAIGPVVLVVTHQDGDKDFPVCRNDIERYRCPKPCPEGTTFSTCQTVLGERLAAAGPRRATRLYMGDFNVPAGTPRYSSIVAGGWIDTHLAAGNPECDVDTGRECTAGRNDMTLATLRDPLAREHERIDFLFVKPASACRPQFDPASDADGDGTGTGLFAPAPAVDGPGGLVWPSDHTAVSMDMTCE